MNRLRFSIQGREINADDPRLQEALAGIYDILERPRCLCQPNGIGMYVEWHRPAMSGKRNLCVLREYLLEAAEDITDKGIPLSARLYVPEPFNESPRAEAARRSREKLSILRPYEGHIPIALVIGEYKTCESTAQG